jgi:radical SAM superfamily enzyme YgiQ (UPF0313 family)
MTAMIDLVLVNPSSRTRVYQSLGTKLAAIENPVWAGLMANYCRAHGLRVEIIDAEAEEWIATEVADHIAELKPRLVAVVAYGHQPSASTQIMTSAGEVCRAIKDSSPSQRVMLVGGHVAALPERTLREEHVDFVATGEGLVTLVQVVEALQSVQPNWAEVSGLCYWDEGQVRRTKEVPLLRDLDQSLPGIAWDLLPMTRYRAHNWHCLDGRNRQPYAALYTTLGCPFHCSFCCIQAPFKGGEQAAGLSTSANSYRYWSPEFVVSQIDTLVQKYGVRNIKIADEMFVLNRKHILGICDRLIERNYDLNIWAYTRVDTIKEGMLPKLRAAGVTWLAVGIESGNGNVRAGVDKAITEDSIHEVIREIREAGINVIGNFIFGLPDDTQATMQETLRLAKDLNCEFANFYSAMAYPGSPLYEQALTSGVPLPREWSGYSQHSHDSLPLPTRHLPAREVLAFRDQAFQDYYTSPRYLQMIQQRFGSATVREIESMTQYQLKRALLDGTLKVPSVLMPATPPEPTWKAIESPRLLTK